MPTPERTTQEQIVGAARQLLETDGLARVTMQAVADRVGVRAPSLYKRVRNRDDLIRLVADAVVADLEQRLHGIDDLPGLARAFRAFAHACPAGYRLILGWHPESGRPATESLARASAPLLRVATALAGPDHALEAARTFTAWANGFLSMELGGSFNLGGDIDHAFEYGIARLEIALRNAD